MDATTREQLRLSILRHRATNPTRFGLTATLLSQYVRAEGLPSNATEMGVEIQYLIDKGLVVEVNKAISPELAAYRVTASGRDLYAQAHGG